MVRKNTGFLNKVKKSLQIMEGQKDEKLCGLKVYLQDLYDVNFYSNTNNLLVY